MPGHTFLSLSLPCGLEVLTTQRAPLLLRSLCLELAPGYCSLPYTVCPATVSTTTAPSEQMCLNGSRPFSGFKPIASTPASRPSSQLADKGPQSLNYLPQVFSSRAEWGGQTGANGSGLSQFGPWSWFSFWTCIGQPSN